MFCYISKTWQGQPLIDIDTTIRLISNTITEKGLTITCQLDEKVYETSHKIPDDELAENNIFFAKLNYVIKPKS